MTPQCLPSPAFCIYVLQHLQTYFMKCLTCLYAGTSRVISRRPPMRTTAPTSTSTCGPWRWSLWSSCQYGVTQLAARYQPQNQTSQTGHLLIIIIREHSLTAFLNRSHRANIIRALHLRINVNKEILTTLHSSLGEMYEGPMRSMSHLARNSRIILSLIFASMH